MSWREWHPDPDPGWSATQAGEPGPFGRPEIKWGGLRARCPACHRAMPSGMWLFTAYTTHYAVAHLRIPVFRSLRRG